MNRAATEAGVTSTSAVKERDDFPEFINSKVSNNRVVRIIVLIRDGGVVLSYLLVVVVVVVVVV